MVIDNGTLNTFCAYFIKCQHPSLLGPLAGNAWARSPGPVPGGSALQSEGLAVERNPHDELRFGGAHGFVIPQHSILTAKTKRFITRVELR